MLKDVVIHLHNEQPLLADLPVGPNPGDMSLICTNLRTMNGKAPVFVERADSTFVLPYAHIHFIEIRPGSVVEGTDKEGAFEPEGERAPARMPASHAPTKRLGSGPGTSGHAFRDQESETEAETGAPSPLRRLAWASGEDVEAPAEGAPLAGAPPERVPDRDVDDEPFDPDELMRRVKEL